MIKDALRKARRWCLRPVENHLERLLLEQGRLQARGLPDGPVDDLASVEFGVFSQNGEDGVLQYLLKQVPIADRSFVEFGVQDYRESNTRFLLHKDHWRGWIIDADDAHQRYVRRESHLGDADLQALQAFITRENIDALLKGAGVPEDLGILSVDIDGNDYWVLEAIQSVRPRILVLEYNSFLGPDLSLSLPYDAGFRRAQQGPGRAYFGASLAAFRTAARAQPPPIQPSLIVPSGRITALAPAFAAVAATVRTTVASTKGVPFAFIAETRSWMSVARFAMFQILAR